MRKLQIKINGKDCYLDLDKWEAENAWREERNNVLHKSMVEFFNKLHHEVNNC